MVNLFELARSSAPESPHLKRVKLPEYSRLAYFSEQISQ
jgi:hypothetical protein